MWVDVLHVTLITHSAPFTKFEQLAADGFAKIFHCPLKPGVHLRQGLKRCVAEIL